jgi:ribosomal protein L37E
VIIPAEADMTIYIRKLNKITGEFDTYRDGELLTPEELEAYEQEKEEKAKDITMICNNCGKHGYSLAKKNGEPRKKQCPECGDQMVQHFSVLVKKDESQIRRKVERYMRDGMDKEQAHSFYNTSIERSKRAIEGVGGASHYKAVDPDMDHLVKTGVAKKMTDQEVAANQQARKEQVVKHAGNKKNFNPNRSNRSQSSK